MKRFLALVLAAACILSAVSCGSAKIRKKEPEVCLAYRVSGGEYTGNRQAGQSAVHTEGLDVFFKESAGRFLSGAKGENIAYSPLNVYMALAMLAELADGSGRKEILDALGANDLEQLRERVSGLWAANYRDDKEVTSILANSVWMNQNLELTQETLDALTNHYYASSYQGEMGSAEFNKALQSWLNWQTGYELEEQTADVKLDTDTVLALITTIYFQAEWTEEFSKNATRESIFYAHSGEETCDFMHQSDSRSYYWGEKFSAVQQELEGNGGMWLLLPDEGVNPDELLADGQVLDFLLAGESWEDSKVIAVNLALPKFDITSTADLIPGLKAMGIEAVFDPVTAWAGETAVSEVQHSVRVRVDEKGSTASAYTVMLSPGAAPPPKEEIDFVLDRPFLFALTGQDGLPLFVGVVNHPAGK